MTECAVMRHYLIISLIFMAVCPIAHAGVVGSGKCGEYMTWTLSDDSVLSFQGRGDMYDYNLKVPPWCTRDYINLTKYIVVGERVTSVGQEAFREFENLTAVSLPSTLATIRSRAFYGCTGLSSVNIPSSVTSIGDYAFYNCKALQSIVIPSSVTSIGCDAFEETRWMELQPYGPIYINNIFYRLKYNGTSDSYQVRSGTTAICGHAFSNCTALKYIEIPNSVTSIGQSAFANCDSLKTVVLPNSITSVDCFGWCSGLTTIEIPNSVRRITASAFSRCNNLMSITIPNSVITIGSSAFSNCKKLESVIIPNSVTSIGSFAFSNCTSLKYVTLSNSLTRIDNYTFSSCSSLISVNIPNSVTSIGLGVFSGCNSLESITIPNSVTSIVGNAFNGCNQLKSVYVSWFRPELVSIIEPEQGVWPPYQSLWQWNYDQTSESRTLYVPRGRSEIYRRNAIWNVIKNIEEYDAESFEPYLTICYDDSVVATQKVKDGNSIEITLPVGYISVRFNGNSVTGEVRNGIYVTPPIATNSTLSVEFEHDRRDNNGDGKLDSQDVLNVYEYMEEQ